jgi:hypothetical protein
MYHSNCKMCVMASIAIGLDCISIGIVVELIAISLDRASMVGGGFDGGFNGGPLVGLLVDLTGGSTVRSTWLCWAIDLSEEFNSSDERLLWLSAAL